MIYHITKYNNKTIKYNNVWYKNGALDTIVNSNHFIIAKIILHNMCMTVCVTITSIESQHNHDMCAPLIDPTSSLNR